MNQAASKGLWVATALVVPHTLLLLGQPKLLYMLNLVLIYAILAIALNLLVGFTGQLSIGHSAFMALGAYTSTIVTLRLGLPLGLGIALAGLVSGGFGYLLGLPALRMKGHYLAILTMAFGIVVPEVLARWDSVTGGFVGLHPAKFSLCNPLFDYLGKGAVSDGSAYYLLLAMLALVYWWAGNLLAGKTGRAFVALRGHESAAKSLGINVTKFKTLAFFYSTFLAGLAGALYAHFVGYVEPKGFDLWMSFAPLIMIVVGGVASVKGSVLGAFLVIMLPEAVTHVTKVPDLPGVLLSLSLILILIFLPHGLVSFVYTRPYQKARALFSGSEKSHGKES